MLIMYGILVHVKCFYLQKAMQIESNLECPICTNRFTADGRFQPKILKCGHTFCTNCIWEISKTEINEIKCSYCSRITHIGVLGAFALPVNVTLIDLLCEINLLDNLKSGAATVDLCKVCENNPAVKICFGCHAMGYMLCEQCCRIEHSRPFAPVQSHKPLNIDEVMKSPKNFCDEHQQLLTHYSEKEAKYACKKCLEEQPDVGMEFLPIGVVTQRLKQNLPSMTEDLEDYLRRLRDSQDRMVTIQGQLGETRSKAMKEVQNKFIMYQNKCQKRQKRLLAYLTANVSDMFCM